MEKQWASRWQLLQNLNIQIKKGQNQVLLVFSLFTRQKGMLDGSVVA